MPQFTPSLAKLSAELFHRLLVLAGFFHFCRSEWGCEGYKFWPNHGFKLYFPISLLVFSLLTFLLTLLCIQDNNIFLRICWKYIIFTWFLACTISLWYVNKVTFLIYQHFFMLHAFIFFQEIFSYLKILKVIFCINIF